MTMVLKADRKDATLRGRAGRMLWGEPCCGLVVLLEGLWSGGLDYCRDLWLDVFVGGDFVLGSVNRSIPGLRFVGQIQGASDLSEVLENINRKRVRIASKERGKALHQLQYANKPGTLAPGAKVHTARRTSFRNN
jgi:hypothetical protein